MEVVERIPERDPAVREGSLALAEMLADGRLPDNNNYADSLEYIQCADEKLRLTKRYLGGSEAGSEERSNSSSLESLNSIPESLDNHMGSQEPDGSTSCSEDSFEMSSTCSTRDTDLSPGMSPYKYREGTVESFTSAGTDSLRTADLLESSVPPSSREGSSGREGSVSSYTSDRPTRRKHCPPSSVSMDSFMLKDRITSVRKNIDDELNALDTGLPQLDFDKLEKQLQTAAQEREDQDRKLLGEQVRRRLAMQVDMCAGPSPSVSTRPARSNLAHRLQTAMNLQVCYINELSELSSSECSSSDSDDEYAIPKSRSVPNLRGARHPPHEGPEIHLLREKVARNEKLTITERQRLLRAETKAVLSRSKVAGTKELEAFRRTKSRASGFPRQSRQFLSKMPLTEIRRILEQIEGAISVKNTDLVQLLIERDTLHMEHDSLLVDIDDCTEHESEAPALDFPLLMSRQSETSYTGTAPTIQSPGGVSLPNFPGTSSSPSRRTSMISSSPSETSAKSNSTILSRFRLFRRS